MIWNVILVDEPRELEAVNQSILAAFSSEDISGMSRNEAGLIVHFLHEPTQAEAVSAANVIGYQGMVRIQQEGTSEYLEINTV